MSFAVSDKVVCVDEPADFTKSLRGEPRECPNGGPKKGSVYVVSRVRINPSGLHGLVLVGLPAYTMLGTDTGWWYRRFRRLDDIKAENRAKHQQAEPLTAVPFGQFRKQARAVRVYLTLLQMLADDPDFAPVLSSFLALPDPRACTDAELAAWQADFNDWLASVPSETRERMDVALVIS